MLRIFSIGEQTRFEISPTIGKLRVKIFLCDKYIPNDTAITIIVSNFVLGNIQIYIFYTI